MMRAHLEQQLRLRHYDIAVHLVSSACMARVNQTHLGHAGPTDVITFDYREPDCPELHGELLICPAIARQQAREHGTSWESEVLRYIVHGLLHLQGYDDLAAADRRIMKREEDRRLKAWLAGSRPHPIKLRTTRHDPD